MRPQKILKVEIADIKLSKNLSLKNEARLSNSMGQERLSYIKFYCILLTHFFGWWLKTLILRDYWLCSVMSIGFELLEYSLEHQLPNFSEYWWDHWILDFLVCNGLGIYLGMNTFYFYKTNKTTSVSFATISTRRGEQKLHVEEKQNSRAI
ncbi:unnamed protein product [Brachionus calyciflorus]|uniref:Phosphatidylserine synthase n=1 Tax=Brachionus calyciflorus TaxID=104777 RepID=A0A813ZVA9_9BILA|nr:unnamed protein product [Brachionus calyciflorus]